MNRNNNVTIEYNTKLGKIFLTEKEMIILELFKDEPYIYVGTDSELFDIIFNLFTRKLLIRINHTDDFNEKWSFAIDTKGKLVFRTDNYGRRKRIKNRNKSIDMLLEL